ncbi:MAG: hypothetical protein ABSB49_03490 [Polyangia bacterium]|jgi:hypothetical protein
MSELNITAIVDTFVNQITAAAESAVAQRLQAAIAGAFGAPRKGRPGRPAKQAAAPVAPVAAPKAAAKKVRRVTPKVMRARKLQGQYLGALRALSAADKAKLKAVAKEKGVAAAVKMAKGTGFRYSRLP